jgi:hypothetical protein
MGKNLSFQFKENNFTAGIVKVDRNKVYGYVEEIVKDQNGEPCLPAYILEDGQSILLNGSTSLKTVDSNGKELDKKTLKTVYLDGKDAVLVNSSFDALVILKEAAMDDLFNLEITTVYQLTWENPEAKGLFLKLFSKQELFQFEFNYRPDYEAADAILLSAKDELFVLTGKFQEFEFLSNTTVAIESSVDVEEQQEEEMDFGML